MGLYGALALTVGAGGASCVTSIARVSEEGTGGMGGARAGTGGGSAGSAGNGVGAAGSGGSVDSGGVVDGTGGAEAGIGSSGGTSGQSGRGGAGGRSPDIDAGRPDGFPQADAGVGPGTPSLCPGSPFAVCQDFEATAVGATPGGSWALATTNYGTGTVLVASDDSARGTHSLKVSIPIIQGANVSTEHYLQLRNLGPLANAHYGRIFVKYQAPTTTPFIHWDLILGAGTFNGTAHRVRWGITGTGAGIANGNWAWLYNVEQGDFGIGDSRLHPPPNQWICIEWMWDGVNQQARFYQQGTESQTLHISGTLAGQNRSPEIPIFTSLNFGLAKYQPNDAPLTFWGDEIAVDVNRIGCGN